MQGGTALRRTPLRKTHGVCAPGMYFKLANNALQEPIPGAFENVIER